MQTILSFSDAYRLDPAGLEDRKQAAKDQLEDAGILLSSTNCEMVWSGYDSSKALDRTERSLEKLVENWSDGDMAFIDHEPDNYSFHGGFDMNLMSLHANLINKSRDALPEGTQLSIYGLPYSMWWKPWSRLHSVYGSNILHKNSKLDWFGPQFYQPYNIGDKAGLDNLRRILTIKNACNAIDPNVEVIPFIQPVLRHPDHDYKLMSDDTIFDMWSALAWAGIRKVIWWYESGPTGGLTSLHREQIKRHAEIREEALSSTFPKE